MSHATLRFTGNSYCYVGGKSEEMFIIGIFLTSNVGCYWPSFRDFALRPDEEATSGNTIYLEKENGYIFLSDLYSQEDAPRRVKVSTQQYIDLLDEWEEKVCKHKPKEVTIKRENGQFVIETSD